MQLLQAIRATRDDYPVAQQDVWCQISPGLRRSKLAARKTISKSSRELTIASGKMIIPSRFGGPLVSFLRPQKPLDETRQSFVQPRGWPVIEQFSRFRNVRASERHIAGLLWQLVDLRFFPKRVFDCNDQVFQLDRLALTEIKDVEERAFVLKR